MIKDIVGYEGLYSISDDGTVSNIITGKVLKDSNTDGYRKVNLTKGNTRSTYRVHRLVAQTFIPNPEEYPEVDHIDEDKTNNCVENLRWCTSKMNKEYYHSIRETDKKDKVYKDMAHMIETIGVRILVDTTECESIGSAARYIHSKHPDRNIKTIQKEIQRMNVGKRKWGSIYGHSISPI